MRLCLSLLQLLSFLVNYPKHLFGQLIAAVLTLTCTHFGNLRASSIIVLTLPSQEACSFYTQLLELLKIQSVVSTTSEVGFDSAELLGYVTRIIGILHIFSRLNEMPTS